MCKNKSYFNEIDGFIKWFPVTKNFNTCWYEETAWERGWLDDPLVSNAVMLCTAYIVITLQSIWTVDHWAFCTYTLYCPRDNIQLRKFCNSIGGIFEATLWFWFRLLHEFLTEHGFLKKVPFPTDFSIRSAAYLLTEKFFRISASFWWCCFVISYIFHFFILHTM